MSYWKGDFQYKETIKNFLSNTQWKKLRDGVFGNFFRLQGVKFCGRLIHCVLLSEIISNDSHSMTFKIFDHEVKFTREAFQIITGLKCSSSVDFKVLGSHDDAMKLAIIYFVESVLMGKRKNRNVSERVMKIVDDDELCSSFNWGSLYYEKLLKSLKSCLKPKQNTSDNENENEKEKDKEKDSYTILGFPFAFCVWIMEVFSIFQEK
nr:uncharacterized protein LOC117280007 [Nicotiana tomentosiformis]